MCSTPSEPLLVKGTSMLVLLPPSETKRVGGMGTFSQTALSRDEQLRDARVRVREALVTLSGDEEVAARALKLGVKNRGELAHNLALETSGTLPVIERYTGVLYDALDVTTLDGAARAWLDANVCVQSALFGLVGAGEQIPAYRLSASSRLPDLGTPLKRVWQEAHAAVCWPADELILDLRSKDYGALAPLPQDRGYFLHVTQRGEDGEVRALNHFNKAAKGDLVRRLARSGAKAADTSELLAWAAIEGLEMSVDESSRTVVLVTALGAPKANGKAAAHGAV